MSVIKIRTSNEIIYSNLKWQIATFTKEWNLAYVSPHSGAQRAAFQAKDRPEEQLQIGHWWGGYLIGAVAQVLEPPFARTAALKVDRGS
jgi:hypothetical protein